MPAAGWYPGIGVVVAPKVGGPVIPDVIRNRQYAAIKSVRPLPKRLWDGVFGVYGFVIDGSGPIEETADRRAGSTIINSSKGAAGRLALPPLFCYKHGETFFNRANAVR
jgi:hypothetical protein